tara:strand:- start:51 stop:875 length:825 start_codon:yes stop_codon:yes gene_type:complete
VYKKRWFDGLQDIYEGKNEFEIKFGCFLGDGGESKSGPKKDPQPPADPTPTPDTGYRGEQTTAAKAAADAAKAAAEAEIEANLAGKAQTAQGIQNQVADVISGIQKGPVDVGGPKSIGTPAEQLAETRTRQEIADSVSLAGLSTGKVSAPTTPVNDLTTAVSLPGTTMAPAVKSLEDMYKDAQSAVIDQAYAEYQNQPNLATQNVLDSLNRGTQGAQNSGQSTQQYGFSLDMPENVSINNPGVGFKYTGPLYSKAKGGVVQQGIGSIFPYPRRR